MKSGWIQINEDRCVPGAQIVAIRALCMAMVERRCAVEYLARQDLQGAQQEWNETHATIDGLALRQEFIESEWSLMGSEVGGCTQRLVDERSWQVEALGVLLWALGRLPNLPEFDDMMDAKKVAAAGPRGLEDSRGFIAKASLRPRDELESIERLSFHWVWRTRPRGPMNVKALPPNVRAANEAFVKDHPELELELVEGDLTVDGKPIFELDWHSNLMSTTRAVVHLRAHALRWLTWGEEWEDVSLDT